MALAIVKVSLRFLDWVPENGDPMLVWVLVVQELLHVIVVTIPMTLFPSMLADLSDHQEMRSGERQEGVIGSIVGFASKLISSVGLIFGGLMLDHFIGMPPGAAKAGIEIESDVLFRLAISDGIIASTLLLIPIGILSTYKMSRRRSKASKRSSLLSGSNFRDFERLAKVAPAAWLLPFYPRRRGTVPLTAKIIVLTSIDKSSPLGIPIRFSHRHFGGVDSPCVDL
ncbi:MAG: hypothetical protein CM15mP68_3700 [Pseudomonadota bacterium]|nr:MAG: hypothetical protein CM15mP68_3700 [Pseudomonadota bacterium]